MPSQSNHDDLPEYLSSGIVSRIAGFIVARAQERRLSAEREPIRVRATTAATHGTQVAKEERRTPQSKTGARRLTQEPLHVETIDEPQQQRNRLRDHNRE